MKLYDYQDAAADFLFERNRGLLLAAVGAGKTAVALTLIKEMLAEGIVKRWLVLAPKRVAKEVWPVEKQKWAPDISMAVGAGGAGQRDLAVGGPAQVAVLNYDVVQSLPDGALKSFDGIIFDELTRLKNPGGKRFKALYKLIAHIDIRYGLTGSFTSNGLEDVFGQCKIVNQEVLGRAKGAFMQTYFICMNREYQQYIPRKDSFSAVMGKVKPMAYLLENTAYVDGLPPLHKVEVKVPMLDRKPYETMRKTFVTEVGGSEITAVTAAAVSQKLSQLASGFAYDECHKASWFSYHKFERLDEILEENQRAPTLVFYSFVEELAELRRRYPHLQTLDDDDAVARFNAGKIELLAAHLASAQYGLNLQETAHHMVFMSPVWSYTGFEQAVGRLHRGGQKNPVWVYILMAEKTIDERIWASLHDKKALAELAIEELKEKAPL